jgi:hypothetical protein
MAIDVKRTMDFGGVARITNLPNAASDQEPATLAQLKAQIEGLAWKENVRVAAQVNTTIASPGATINAITMAANDRVLLMSQTTVTENGIYIWNGAATPMTRSLDATTFDELESAVVTVDEGTSAGATFRQTQVNGVIGTNNVVWASFGTSSPASSETVQGIAELATQGETDTGTDDLRIVTPLKLANWAGRSRVYNATFGDGAASSYVITHSLNTRNVVVEVFRNSGNYDTVHCEIQRTSVNAVTLVFDALVASNALSVTIKA